MAAVFSLAHKLQPAIIFIDEVDSFLGQRRTTDHEALTNMKTEFMALWDGFTTDRKSPHPILLFLFWKWVTTDIGWWIWFIMCVEKCYEICYKFEVVNVLSLFALNSHSVAC